LLQPPLLLPPLRAVNKRQSWVTAQWQHTMSHAWLVPAANHRAYGLRV